MAIGGTKVVQVTNIAPQATKDQMQTLFGYLGKIEDIRLYPTVRDVSCPVQSRICYIKFVEANTVGIAQHMTNTVFIDRALIVLPVTSGDIPDEYYALEMTRNGTIVPGLCPSEPKLPANVVNSISGTGNEQVIVTSDPQLEANDLPFYPPLPVNYDSVKIEEVRRTIYMGNVDMNSSILELAEFFQMAGEIKYLRSCVRESDGSEYFMIEFSDQPSILGALKLNGTEFKGKPVTIMHSTQAIVKPQAKSNEAAQKEIEEAMIRVKEAQSMISAAIDPVIGMLSKDKRSSRRTRSRSRGRRRRSRSRSRPRRSRSRGGGGGGGGGGGRRKSRSRERSRERRRRSRSKKRSRSRSRRSTSRKRSRSKSHSKTARKHRSREKSRDKRSRDRSKERPARREPEKRERDRRSDREAAESEKKRSRSSSRTVGYRSRSRDRASRHSREKKRSRSKERKRQRSISKDRKKSRSRSRDRKREKKDRKDKERSRSRSKVRRNYDEEEKGFDSEKERSAQESDVVEKESSEKSDNMDISNSP